MHGLAILPQSGARRVMGACGQALIASAGTCTFCHWAADALL